MHIKFLMSSKVTLLQCIFHHLPKAKDQNLTKISRSHIFSKDDHSMDSAPEQRGPGCRAPFSHLTGPVCCWVHSLSRSHALFCSFPLRFTAESNIISNPSWNKTEYFKIYRLRLGYLTDGQNEMSGLNRFLGGGNYKYRIVF